MGQAFRIKGLIPLLLLVAAKLIVHALYVPAFEGPDEPFHLAHTRNVWRSDVVTADIVGSIRQHPCSNDLNRATGCPPFGRTDAEFNALRFDATHAAAPVVNYEAHQPPVYYALGNAWLRLFSARHDAVWQLLWMRIFSVVLVLLGLMVFRHSEPSARLRMTTGALLVLLVPGAAESLARCANDAGVFAWCALVMCAIARKAPTYVLALLALVGPLVKLTSIPVIAFVVTWALLHRGWGDAGTIAITSAVFLPIQGMRGYVWGGTVELNAASTSSLETKMHALAGFARSAYTFVKTTYWLGEWSFFKAPLWLLALTAAYLIVFIASVKWRRTQWLPHAIGLAVAMIATAAFFVSHRRFWGDWGGVGGWYAWGWFPWLAVAMSDAIEVPVSRRRLLFGAGAAIVVIANVAWFAAAHAIYG